MGKFASLKDAGPCTSLFLLVAKRSVLYTGIHEQIGPFVTAYHQCIGPCFQIIQKSSSQLCRDQMQISQAKS